MFKGLMCNKAVQSNEISMSIVASNYPENNAIEKKKIHPNSFSNCSVNEAKFTWCSKVLHQKVQRHLVSKKGKTKSVKKTVKKVYKL